MTVPVVNEKSTAYLVVTFKDKNGAPSAPTSITYRIDDLNTGQQIRGDTTLASAVAVEITLTAVDNTLINQANAYETRRVTVKATYGTADAVNSQFDYYVKNLLKVT